MATCSTCRLRLILFPYHRQQQQPSICFYNLNKRRHNIFQKQQILTTIIGTVHSGKKLYGDFTKEKKQQTNQHTQHDLVSEIEHCYNRLDLSFENVKESFKSKSNMELVRALVVFECCKIDWLVQNNQHILQMLRKLMCPAVFKRVLKSTFYGHFVAGETLEEVSLTVSKLQRFGVKSILDYSVESDISHKEAQEKAVEGIHGEALGENAKLPEALDVLRVRQEQEVQRHRNKQAELPLVKPEQTHKRFSVHKEFGDRREQVVSARTYFYSGETDCDRNADIFCRCIDSTSKATHGEGFTVIKLTALGRPRLLMRLTEAIAQMQNLFKVLTGSNWENLVMSRIDEAQLLERLQQFGVQTSSSVVNDWFKNVDFDEDGFVDFFEWGKLLDLEKQAAAQGINEMFRILNIKTGLLEPLIPNLSDRDILECANMMGRLNQISDYAVEKGVRLMIDAEQTYFQPAISRLTIALMRRHNRQFGQVLNTYQAYLRTGLSNLLIDMHLARRENFHFGCKLVRGAYMEQERKRAKTIGYDDPINNGYEATSAMYHRCLDSIVEEWAQRGRGSVSVMVASHNLDTVRYAVELMKQHRIAPSERMLCFGQLYGMCEAVSFSLGQAGYSVYKYIPWGPVEGVLPYLSRRALENGAMLKSVGTESRLIWTELKRRIRSGQLLYRPPMSMSEP